MNCCECIDPKNGHVCEHSFTVKRYDELQRFIMDNINEGTTEQGNPLMECQACGEYFIQDDSLAFVLDHFKTKHPLRYKDAPK